MPGAKRLPRVRVHPEFHRAVRDAMYRGQKAWMLSTFAGFAQASKFTNLVFAPEVADSLTTRERFTRVAEAVGYTGPVFEEQAQTLEAQS